MKIKIPIQFELPAAEQVFNLAGQSAADPDLETATKKQAERDAAEALEIEHRSQFDLHITE